MELNKLIGAVCATLLTFLGLQFFAELIYHPPKHGDHHAELAYSIEIEDEAGDEEPVEVDYAAIFAAADAASGEKVFRKCSACHKMEDGANAAGPHLYGVVNRPIGSVAGFNYSGRLPSDQAWTPENLYNFLAAPKKWAPGTSMGFAGLKKSEDRAALIAWLNDADGSPEPLQ